MPVQLSPALLASARQNCGACIKLYDRIVYCTAEGNGLFRFRAWALSLRQGRECMRPLQVAVQISLGAETARTQQRKAMNSITMTCVFLGVALCATTTSLQAAEQRGVTDTEIRIGQTMPYSGALSAYSALGKAEIAYFNLVNDRGGINGRKVRLISLDDGYVPPKTVEQTRRLVESDEVALIFSSLGTAQNTAIAKYLQAKNVPQLFLASGASKFGDVSQFPQALMGIQAPFRLEARLYARYILSKLGQVKIAVLAQNDDFGRDYLAGLKDVIGANFDQVVTSAIYEVTEPTIESHIARLRASGADAFLIAATPKFAAQAIRKLHEIGWKPMTLLSNVSVWVSSVMEVAGLDAGVGIVSSIYV